MANFTIPYACGHGAERQLFGKHDDRQRYIAWAAQHGTCPACAAQNKAGAVLDVEAEHELPALTGSDRQVEWARKIRADKISEFAELIAKRLGTVPADKRDTFEDQNAMVLVEMAGKTTARWWIDNRDESAFALARRLYAQARG